MSSDAWRANRSVFDDGAVVGEYAGAGSDLMADEELLYHRYVPIRGRVLDLGVGTGRTTPFLLGRASAYVGIDYAPRMVQVARSQHPSADLRVGDASDLSDFQDQSFDCVVFSYNGIDYLHPQAARGRCLEEIRRVLRPEGTFLHTQHNPRGIVDPGSFDVPAPRGLLVGGYVTARRASRMLGTRAFYSGRGYVAEPTRGGLVTHAATLVRSTEELAAHHLEVVAVVSGRSPRRRASLFTPWFSYAAVAR